MGGRRAVPLALRARARARRQGARAARRVLSDYLVPAGAAEAETRERGSRYFAFVAAAESAGAAREFVAALERRFDDASHVCFAWRVGWPPAERSSDAGEPPGTAGAPLLATLRGAGLTDVVVAVVRYFGGTRLGRGGLARAYAAALAQALERLPTRVESERVRLVVRTSHERQGAVRRLLRPGRVELANERYDERVELVLAVALDELPALERALADLGVETERRRESS